MNSGELYRKLTNAYMSIVKIQVQIQSNNHDGYLFDPVWVKADEAVKAIDLARKYVVMKRKKGE